jgi:hypothetical protein
MKKCNRLRIYRNELKFGPTMRGGVGRGKGKGENERKG